MVKWNDSKSKPQAGLTLIGVVIAVLVFSIVLIATTQLMARTEKNVGISREQFIATNLAREGLELVQYSRDRNWLTPGATRATWTNKLIPLCPDNNPHSFRIEPDPDTTNPLRIQMQDISPTGPNPPITVLPQTLYVDSNGHYSHNASSGARSPFAREITIKCGTRDDELEKDEHIDVTSRVFWNSRGQNREIVVMTRLYNWRQ